MRFNVILKIILALLILAGTCGLLWWSVNTWSRKVEIAQNNPTITYVEPEVIPPTDVELIPKVEKAILKYYGVTEFPEIGYQSSDNLLTWFTEITPTNPDSNDGELTLHFVAQPEVGVFTQKQAHDVAYDVMSIIKSDFPQIQGITALTEVFNFRTNDYGATIASERVGRDEV